MRDTIISTKRIEIIDALRGFALMGILLVHCQEHFDAFGFTGEANAFVAPLNSVISEVIEFFFLGKAYAIFSLLFGLSFFIQMEKQADKGIDFRLRFAWRLFLLYLLGHLNGLFYSGEILVVYALWGLILIPIHKLSTRWLFRLCLILLLQLPSLIYLGGLLLDPQTYSLTDLLRKLATGRFREMMVVLTEGSFTEVMAYNLWKGQVIKWLYYLQPINMFRIIGLFMAGVLIGRWGIHKDENLMVKYAKRGVWWGLTLFTLFFYITKILPAFGWEGQANRIATQLCRMYSNLGLMFFIVGVLYSPI
ncbi:MAG: DUF418 domain-containing protein [Bacteroides sp.]|nr:DUF418 domain-containing protein [Bacteroides sp.]